MTQEIRKSTCCDAVLINGAQCEGCGADGRNFTQKIRDVIDYYDTHELEGGNGQIVFEIKEEFKKMVTGIGEHQTNPDYKRALNDILSRINNIPF